MLKFYLSFLTDVRHYMYNFQQGVGCVKFKIAETTIKYDEFGNKSQVHREQETEQFSEKKSQKGEQQFLVFQYLVALLSVKIVLCNVYGT